MLIILHIIDARLNLYLVTTVAVRSIQIKIKLKFFQFSRQKSPQHNSLYYICIYSIITRNVVFVEAIGLR